MAQTFLVESEPLLKVRNAEPHAIHLLEHVGEYLQVNISPSSKLPTPDHRIYCVPISSRVLWLALRTGESIALRR